MTQKEPKYELKLLFKNRVNISIGVDLSPNEISARLKTYLTKPSECAADSYFCSITDYMGNKTNFDVRELIVWTTMLIPLESDIVMARPAIDAMGKIVNDKGH